MSETQSNGPLETAHRNSTYTNTITKHKTTQTHQETKADTDTDTQALAADIETLSVNNDKQPSSSSCSSSSLSSSTSPDDSSPAFPSLSYVTYSSETQLRFIQQLIDNELSEPYSVFTYRYFLNNWPHLCFLAMLDNNTNTSADSKSPPICVGTIICKLSSSISISRGYIAMLCVSAPYRHHHIGSVLVNKAIQAMQSSPQGCDVVVLETEVTNTPALALYEKLNFIRDCRLSRYYLNGGDAFRLKLWFSTKEERQARINQHQQQQQLLQQQQQQQLEQHSQPLIDPHGDPTETHNHYNHAIHNSSNNVGLQVAASTTNATDGVIDEESEED